MTSAVLIIPDALRADANAVAEQMGWGANNYSVPLTSNGAITHWGLHANTSEQFRGWVEGTEPLPDGLEHAQFVIDALISSFRNDLFGAGHFAVVLESHGLQRWPAPININDATSETLQTLPDVSTVRAEAIIAGRPWDDPAQLSQISGISDAMVEGWMAEPGLLPVPEVEI